MHSIRVFPEFQVIPYYEPHEPQVWFMVNSQNVKSEHLSAVIM